MHAYLIISTNDQIAHQKALDLAVTNNATLTPIGLQKISDVRELGHLTKLSLRNPTAFFIEHIDKASIDAVNAFLKQLEEPKKNTYYILTAESEDKAIPTIVSRCQVVRTRNNEQRTINRGADGIRKLLPESIGLQFSKLDKIKKRDDAISFLQELILALHQELLSYPTSRISQQLSTAQQALTALEKNGNVTSQLTRMVVAWNK
jgi:hypothetical protein